MSSKSTPHSPDKVEKLSKKQALRAMGEFFELDKKKIDWYIKQLELSGKL